MIRRLAGSKSEIIRAPLPKDDPTRRKPDIARAQQLLGGWAPRCRWKRGCAATIEDFKRRFGTHGAQASDIGPTGAARRCRGPRR